MVGYCVGLLPVVLNAKLVSQRKHLKLHNAHSFFLNEPWWDSTRRNLWRFSDSCWKLSQPALQSPYPPLHCLITIRPFDTLYSNIQICQHLKRPLTLPFSFVMLSLCSFSLLNVVGTSRMRWVRRVACRMEIGNSYKNLTWKSQGKRPMRIYEIW
jgi:hypothetical protein